MDGTRQQQAHTPGPWFDSTLRTHSADPANNGIDIGAENGANVALVLYRSSEHTEAEARANARLVAAAPDLLRQLQALLKYADGIHRVQAYVDEHDVDYVTFPDVRAAIAKATGAA
jgi:hypothetical protein